MAKFEFRLGGLHFEQVTAKEVARIFNEFEEAKQRAEQKSVANA